MSEIEQRWREFKSQFETSPSDDEKYDTSPYRGARETLSGAPSLKHIVPNETQKKRSVEVVKKKHVAKPEHSGTPLKQWLMCKADEGHVCAATIFRRLHDGYYSKQVKLNRVNSRVILVEEI